MWWKRVQGIFCCCVGDATIMIDPPDHSYRARPSRKTRSPLPRSSGFFDLSKGRYDFHSLKDVVFDFLAGLRFFDFLALKSSCSAAANFRLWPAPPVLARPAEIAVVVEV